MEGLTQVRSPAAMRIVKRKKEKTEPLAHYGFKAPPELQDVLLEIAQEHDRSVSHVIKKLVGRGIAAYRRDGELNEPLADSPGSAATPQTRAPEVSLIVDEAAPDTEHDKKQRPA
jgi:hypothetical protein